MNIDASAHTFSVLPSLRTPAVRWSSSGDRTLRQFRVKEQPLAGIIAKGWQLKKPLTLEWDQDEDGYYVGDYVFNVYGYGDSPRDAYQDYVVSLIEYYQLLGARAQDDSDTLKTVSVLTVLYATNLSKCLRAMPIKVRDFERMLQSKFEFTIAPTRSNDHRWYELKLPGLPAILTKVSHGEKDLSKGLEGKIARQLRIPKPFFREMFACTKNAEEYERQIRQNPYPPWDVLF